MPRQWNLVKSEKMHTDPWTVVLRKTYRIDGGGSDEIHIVLEKPQFVMAIAIDEANRILLVRQYRHGTEQSYWSLPGGFIDAGETPGVAAKRELLEETGYAARRVSYITTLHPMPGCVDTRAHIVLCEGIKKDSRAVLDAEIDSTDLLPLNAVLQKILSGEIQEMQGVAAILLAQQFLRQRKKKKTRPATRSRKR
jgi:ADP-ribose pyrophosphatase YjhB (NUDIX family)